MEEVRGGMSKEAPAQQTTWHDSTLGLREILPRKLYPTEADYGYSDS
jgi:hypothetical protein